MFTENSSFMSSLKKKKSKNSQVTLKLTSMIDMFTILLVFLLKSFSTEGQVITISDDLKLPESTAQKVPESASSISVTAEWILIDGKQVASVAEVISSNELLINGLANELKKQKAISESVGELSDNIGFTGKISIQGDKEIPYQLLKKVMFTCGQTGYNEILLAVIQKE